MEDNLLEALEKADFDPGNSYESDIKDFTEGNQGEVSFTYDGIKETLSYAPVTGTDWFLAYLIRESLKRRPSILRDGACFWRKMFRSMPRS